jgi:guanylate kinase
MNVKNIDQIIAIFRAEHKKRFVLVGNAASGKDYARKILESLGYPYQISYTTRPMRVGEVHGKDYYFIPEYKFQELVKIKFFYEHVSFNGWQYGTSNAQMKTRDCTFIMTPSGLAHMSEVDRKDSLVVYFDIPEEIRKERLAIRSDADTVDRRIEADRRDFEDFKNYDIILNDPNYK